MPFDLTQTVAPTAEPVTLAIAKAHLRVTWTDDDDYIAELIAGARDAAETECGRAFITRTYTLTLADFPRLYSQDCGHDILLPVGPVGSVTGITYTDSAGATQTLATTDYSVGAKTARISPVVSWPTTYYPYSPENVTVTYTAGFGPTYASVPAAARAAVLLILADRYENRGDNMSNFLADRPIPAAALRLLGGLRDGNQW